VCKELVRVGGRGLQWHIIHRSKQIVPSGTTGHPHVVVSEGVRGCRHHGS